MLQGGAYLSCLVPELTGRDWGCCSGLWLQGLGLRAKGFGCWAVGVLYQLHSYMVWDACYLSRPGALKNRQPQGVGFKAQALGCKDLGVRRLCMPHIT